MSKTLAIVLTAAVAAVIAVLAVYAVSILFGMEFRPAIAGAIAASVGAVSAVQANRKKTA